MREIITNTEQRNGLTPNKLIYYLIVVMKFGNIYFQMKENFCPNIQKSEGSIKSQHTNNQQLKIQLQSHYQKPQTAIQNIGLLLTSQITKGKTIYRPFGVGIQISPKLIIANIFKIGNSDKTQFVYSPLGCSKSNILKQTDSKYQQITVKLFLKYQRQEQINSLLSGTQFSVGQLSEQHGLLQYKVTKTDLETLIQLLNIENFSQALDLDVKKKLNSDNQFLLNSINETFENINKSIDNKKQDLVYSTIINKCHQDESKYNKTIIIIDKQNYIKLNENLTSNYQNKDLTFSYYFQDYNQFITKNNSIGQKNKIFSKKIGNKSVYFSHGSKLLQIRIINHQKGTETLVNIDQKALRQDQFQIVQNISQFYAIFRAKAEKQAQNLDNIFTTDQNYLTAYFSKGLKPRFSKLKATTIPFNDPTIPKVNKNEPFQKYQQKLDHYFNRKEQKFNQNIKNFQLQAIQRLNDFEQKLLNKVKFELQQKLKKIIIQFDANINKKVQIFAQRLNNIQQQSKAPLVKMDSLLYTIQSKAQQLQRQLCRIQKQRQHKVDKKYELLSIQICQDSIKNVNDEAVYQQIIKFKQSIQNQIYKRLEKRLQSLIPHKDKIIQSSINSKLSCSTDSPGNNYLQLSMSNDFNHQKYGDISPRYKAFQNIPNFSSNQYKEGDSAQRTITHSKQFISSPSIDNQSTNCKQLSGNDSKQAIDQIQTLKQPIEFHINDNQSHCIPQSSNYQQYKVDCLPPYNLLTHSQSLSLGSDNSNTLMKSQFSEQLQSQKTLQ